MWYTALCSERCVCVCFILGTANPIDVLVEREEELLPVDCPHFDSLVIRGCDQILSITSKVYTAYSGRVSLEHCRLSLPTHRHTH